MFAAPSRCDLRGPSPRLPKRRSLRGFFMLRIETETDGARVILRLIGRMRSDYIEELRERVQNRASVIVLDLAQVNLVDLQSVRFLRDCQDRKIELLNCPAYIREWIRRERVEGQDDS